jgi:hypothetical protein
MKEEQDLNDKLTPVPRCKVLHYTMDHIKSSKVLLNQVVCMDPII